ncbi:hypothetical protein COW36_01300 [bacterium (Candidatus Blackallbacteria) CG17_big_fil_post_rev_8_21_14_2_50_48_46]|uniref:Uncharacterized protein n=1 Tax=bacterium (Candidatus Blackallbacteria) CG17_big_fil_post_rev_8_21_14_2_50_48_46 TaxID=2014261 RepID=A0A2M7GC38_9BACT|nr:MAG: hypothetical protein COW64_09875 [bacterium (Candidatus Blackallbacteria) CG18_big_fil_WC_8_21_14_2_50_49_26]PIW19503.1 MAG: hypothetical protein COW36_01300 [bacterium (Candidatus Blackallbacteria) CG17_big_fil_post_rev_8_21_14_2_50_48_46]PIW48893.1 MAG: hypothetical protein COW20_07155 [bacterium (Candidatus Blackallbacteria) CG13_big_fil_rev_8_21_14_2_50_49_14]
MPETSQAPAASASRRRHEESLELYARGMECLLQAEEEGFKNKRLMQEAADCLIDSIRKNRRFVEPHIAMGYLLWLYNDPAYAMQYLEEALRLEPTHEDIHVMIAKIKGRPLKTEELELIAFADAPEPATVAENIEEALGELAEEKTSAIVPSINPHLVARLEEKQVYWFHRFEELQVQANRSRDLATKNHLREQIQPLRERTQQYRDALRVSQEMIALSDQILENDKTVQTYLEVSSKPMSSAQWQEMQGYIDILLDNCDQFADTLDEMDGRGIPLRALSTQYEQLSERIEDLQSQLARQTG